MILLKTLKARLFDMSFILRLLLTLLVKFIRRFAWEEFRLSVIEVQMHELRIFGCKSRLTVHPTAQLNNALINLNSGNVIIGAETFFGHEVSILTGTHNPSLTGLERRCSYPSEGYDIHIGDGVWIGSNATILGPCNIGRNAVVGAMSLVKNDIPENAIVAGIPARIIKNI